MLRVPSRPPEPEVGARARSVSLGGSARAVHSSRGRTVALAIVGALAALLILVGLLFGSIVRSKVRSEAERRNLDVEVGGVRPGFFSVTLRDVRIKPRGMSGIEARLDQVTVDLRATFSAREVRAKGGGIVLEGEPDEVAERLRDLRRRGGSSEAAGSSTSKLPISVEDLSLTWKMPASGDVSGTGIRASRDDHAIKVGCARCSMSQARPDDKISATMTGADGELAPDGTVRRIAITTLDIERQSTKVAAPRPPPTTTAEMSPPPLPLSVGKKGKRTLENPSAPPNDATPIEPIVPWPDLRAARARLLTMIAAFAPRIPPETEVAIQGLSAKLDVGGEPMAFGPGTFSLSRRNDRLHLTFESAPSAAPVPTSQGAPGTPLALNADLPISGTSDIRAELAGGPVPLAALGVKEGTKGLTDVANGSMSGKGQLVLSGTSPELTFDGQLTLKNLSLKQPKIAPDTLRGIDFTVAGRGVYTDGGNLRVDDAQLDMGALHVRTHGTVEETADHFGVALALDVAPAACQSLLDSAPQGLLPLVRSARMGGTFGASVNLAFDTRTIDKLTLDYRVDDQCRMLEVPRDMSREHFEGSFTYRTYHPDGTKAETTTGPGSSSWTSLDDISPFMIVAVLTTEDGAFYRHKGFNHSAIRSSVAANLKARRFVRGASTITMQLAKNLFLAREKALSRKIEEVILTDYLEQIFRKDDMMELYLNVIEFGPDVYGITQAADYYFRRKPEELNLSECFFLASLLPSPLRYSKMRDKGEVSEAWLRHLHALMAIAAKNGKITSAELEEGRREGVVFSRPSDPAPEPRKPVSSKRRDPLDDDDSAWRPVD